MKFTIKHRINYFFKGSFKSGYQKVLLRPRNNDFQKIIKWNIDVIGGCKETSSHDQFYNEVDIFRLRKNISLIEYKVDGIVETKKNNGILKLCKQDLPIWCFINNYELTYPGLKLINFFKKNRINTKNLIMSLHELSKKIRRLIRYKKGKTNYKTTAEESIVKGYGVCQDHTHIFLSIVRQNNIPCRYVSGYLLPIKEEKDLHMHAWAEVFIKNLGWLGFDISNGISPNERYIVVAKGFDFNNVTPIKGIINGFVKEELKSKLKIQMFDQ